LRNQALLLRKGMGKSFLSHPIGADRRFGKFASQLFTPDSIVVASAKLRHALV
jgi:hypothetical protein